LYNNTTKDKKRRNFTVTTKQQLLTEAEEQFQTLLNFIHTIPAKKRTFSIETTKRNKNFRDVLMHLYEWHAMLERWYREGMDGDTPEMPAPGFKWRQLDKLNDQIRDNYDHIKLSQAIKKVTLSHHRIFQLIEQHTDEQIFTKQYYKWTKTSNLYSYFAANTSSHYSWAIKQCTYIAAQMDEQFNVIPPNKKTCP